MRGFFYCSSQPISTQHRANFAIRKSIAQMLFNRRECACVFDLRDGFADGLGFFGSEERVGCVNFFYPPCQQVRGAVNWWVGKSSTYPTRFA